MKTQSMATKTEYVPRVNQIDAITLNRDIVRLIRDNLLDSLQSIWPHVFAKVQPELDLLVQSGIWLGSVGKRCSTFGQQLLVLSYDSECLTISRLCLHFGLTVLPSYIKSLDERRLQAEWLHRFIQWTENIALILSVANFFRFLYTGRKPTLVDYMLNLDFISLRHNQRRDIGYKYLTRELLWGGFMEMLGLVLPIINFRKIYRILKSAVIGKSLQNSKNLQAKPLIVQMTKHTNCAYCGERPTLPHRMGCEHIYCYYCLAANVATDAQFHCINCDFQHDESQIFPL